jgi:ABC-type transport system involved in cytochrome c biogenesis permease subunit
MIALSYSKSLCISVLTLMIILLSWVNPAYAYNADIPGTTLDMDNFAGIPVLHEGRIKPLDSLARIQILRFAKREMPTTMSPIEWLAKTLFNPAVAVEDKIFLIEDGITRHTLGLEERKRPFYSYAELIKGLEKTTPLVTSWISQDDFEPTEEQANLLAVHENALEYLHLLRSLSAILPLIIEIPEKLVQDYEIDNKAPITFLTLQKFQPDIEEKIRGIISKRGKNPANYSSAEQSIVTLGWQLKTLQHAGQNNAILRVIPLSQDGHYASLWEIIHDGKGSPQTQISFEHWKNLTKAYQNNDKVLWDNSIQIILENDTHATSARITVEKIYNSISPFYISILLFSLALILSCIYLVTPLPLIYTSGLAIIALALIAQTLGLVFRVYIMERPPVGTLYESIIFVGLVAPLIAAYTEYRWKNGLGLLSAAISGSILGILGHSMMGEGDNMKVLGAVLNTRFWLTTHVLCITIGYGWCLLTSVLAHVTLLGQAIGRLPKATESELIKSITTHSMIALLFTTIGTILGGIWADQSWGRFWGWDPKENGALLIVLWLIWIIHGKIAGQIGILTWLAGMAFLSVIVGIAWIGVNLLGVGLHSYGFIEGVFWSLNSFIVFEIIVIGFLMARIRMRQGGVHEN